ncbi:MAG: hypothetical protein V3T17_03005 [Pseudomonadales bacterium]
MDKFLAIAVTSALLVLPLSVSAAKPTSVTFESNGSTPDGVNFSSYIVKCSNGLKQPLTAWDQRKKWCVGSESIENCHKKQIKAAKKACKA